MEKLTELLNEYDNWNWWVTDYWSLFNKYNEWISEEEYLQVISKKFWFIKRLVDNNKINFDKLDDNTDWYYIELDDNYLEMLALLAIQDNPIELLISILK